jgi:hypothetical protein
MRLGWSKVGTNDLLTPKRRYYEDDSNLPKVRAEGLRSWPPDPVERDAVPKSQIHGIHSSYVEK